MEDVAWRAGLTILLLVALALTNPRAAPDGHAPGAVQEEPARYLPAGAGNAPTVHLPCGPPCGEPLPDATPCLLDVAWLDGSPLAHQDRVAMSEVAWGHPWVEVDRTPTPH